MSKARVVAVGLSTGFSFWAPSVLAEVAAPSPVTIGGDVTVSPPASGEGDPKQTIAVFDGVAFGRAFHCHQLLPQREVLQDQFLMSAEGPMPALDRSR